MKFLPKMPQRILGIELQRELLLSGKNHGGLAQTFNSKAINQSSQLSTVRGCCMNSMVVPSGSRRYTTRFPAFGPDRRVWGLPAAFQPDVLMERKIASRSSTTRATCTKPTSHGLRPTCHLGSAGARYSSSSIL